MINNEEEIWRALPSVTGVEVSTFGRVRTLDKVVSNGRGTYLVKGRVLKPFGSGNGYLCVSIKVDGKWTKKTIHRLVAQAFIDNPDNLPQVNHKDCDRTNNDIKNLEWCDGFYNQQYRQKYGASQRQPIFAVNLTTLEVSRFKSQIEAGRVLEVDKGNINKVIKGKLKQANGYWFVSDDGHAVDVVKSKLHNIGGTGLKIKQGR